MSFESGQNLWGASAAQTALRYDADLRAYMLKVYNYMGSALALTGLVAWFVANTPAVLSLFFTMGRHGSVSMTGLGWLVVLAPIGLALAFSFGMARMRASTASALFWVYAGLMGISLSTILLQYTGTSVARVFFITAASFGGLSLYGYTTKRDLSGFGTFLMMGLIGLMVASIVNIFIASSALQFVMSVVGVLIFAGLTAYDTQQIKDSFFAYEDAETVQKKALMGAFQLYLDFINLFIYLLRFFGDRRE